MAVRSLNTYLFRDKIKTMIDQLQTNTELLLKEYETVTAGQAARIGFRDNLLYVSARWCAMQ